MEISKKSVDQAGKVLLENPADNKALDSLAKWRSKHVYALGLAFKLLKSQTDKIGNNAIYGQRLKRAISIINKLKRLQNSNLSRMQDIGGCRVILTNYNKLQGLYLNLQKNRSILKNHKDYITYPKADGYRGIHLIYKCNSKKFDSKDLKIEFQLRTKLQHAWATTVEIIDLFENQQLKNGEGDCDWQKFFWHC